MILVGFDRTDMFMVRATDPQARKGKNIAEGEEEV